MIRIFIKNAQTMSQEYEYLSVCVYMYKWRQVIIPLF